MYECLSDLLKSGYYSITLSWGLFFFPSRKPAPDKQEEILNIVALVDSMSSLDFHVKFLFTCRLLR